MNQGKISVWHSNLLIIYSVTLMSIMSVSIIAPALPKMAHALNVSRQQIGWLITSYTIPGMILAMFVGILADKLGRKAVLVPSLFLFGLAGGGCFFVHRFTWLVALRFVQGIGGAALSSISAIIIGDLFERQQRVRIMGINASVLSVGTGSFPFLGGTLALIAWNFPFLFFLVSIPIGLLAFLFLRIPSIKAQQHFKKYIKEAIVHLKTAKAGILFLLGIITFIMLYGGILTYFAILMADKFHVSSFVIGVFLSLMSLTTAIVSSQVGRLSQKIDRLQLIQIGFAGYALSSLMLPFVPEFHLMIVPMIIFGVGHGLNIPLLQILSTELAPPAYRGIAVTLFGTMLRTGQTIGPLLFGAILLFTEYHGLYAIAALIAFFPILLLAKFKDRMT